MLTILSPVCWRLYCFIPQSAVGWRLSQNIFFGILPTLTRPRTNLRFNPTKKIIKNQNLPPNHTKFKKKKRHPIFKGKNHLSKNLHFFGVQNASNFKMLKFSGGPQPQPCPNPNRFNQTPNEIPASKTTPTDGHLGIISFMD